MKKEDLDKLIDNIIHIMTNRKGMDTYHDIDEEFQDEIKQELREVLNK